MGVALTNGRRRAASRCEDARMSCVVRERFVERASRLRDCADLNAETRNGLEFIELTPRTAEALGLYLLLDTDGGAVQLGSISDWDLRDEEPTVASVDLYIDAAVEGRFRVLRGPRRYEVHIQEGTRATRITTVYDGLVLPRPRWRSRAHVITYAGYRTATAS